MERSGEYHRVTLSMVKKHPVVEAYIAAANEHTGAIGYTEHGFRHAALVASIARNILQRLEYPERRAELAEIAGYCHDIGNAVGRSHHGAAGALIMHSILLEMRMDPGEVAVISGAIGNHEEEVGQPVNDVCAALILADKSDVHRSRVRNTDPSTFDIHDRVSYSAVRSFLKVDEAARTITLELTIETEVCPVMDYFEIFLTRMIMCRRAAEMLSCSFKLDINGAKLL